MLSLRTVLFSMCLLVCCVKAPDPTLFAPVANNVVTAPAPTTVAIDVPQDWAALDIDQSFYLGKWDLPNGGRATVSFLGSTYDAASISMNIDRWMKQWEVPGSSPEEDREFGVKEVDGVGMYQLVLQGTLNATAQLGGGEPRADWMLIGAIMVKDFGPVYLKVMGPSADLESQVEAIYASFSKATF
jgi:hypothetical protein